VLEVVGKLLPVGLAAALSSVPIMVMIVILLSPRRKVAAVPYAIGCVLGTVLVVGLVTVLAQLLPDPRPRQPPTALVIVELLLGAGLIVLGVRSWRRHGQASEAMELPPWATSLLDSVSAARAIGLGVIIELRPKSVLLAGVVGLQLHGVSGDPAALAVLIGYVVIATSTVTVPVLLTITSPARMEPKLMAASKTLAAEGPVISAVVLVMVGAVVIGAGLQDLE
jgi:hypothetical protein